MIHSRCTTTNTHSQMYDGDGTGTPWKISQIFTISCVRSLWCIQTRSAHVFTNNFLSLNIRALELWQYIKNEKGQMNTTEKQNFQGLTSPDRFGIWQHQHIMHPRISSIPALFSLFACFHYLWNAQELKKMGVNKWTILLWPHAGIKRISKSKRWLKTWGIDYPRLISKEIILYNGICRFRVEKECTADLLHLKWDWGDGQLNINWELSLWIVKWGTVG